MVAIGQHRQQGFCSPAPSPATSDWHWAWSRTRCVPRHRLVRWSTAGRAPCPARGYGSFGGVVEEMQTRLVAEMQHENDEVLSDDDPREIREVANRLALVGPSTRESMPRRAL